MYPGHWAQVKPDDIAVVNTVDGTTLSWAELNARSNQVAHFLRAQGLDTGGHVALFMENHLDYFVIAWATFRSGLYLTCINRYLTSEEAAYIINDSNSKVLFASAELQTTVELPALLEDCPHLEFQRTGRASLKLVGQPNQFLEEQESF